MDLDESHKMSELLDAAKPALLELSEAGLLRPRISRERALYMTSMLRRELLPVTPLFSVELSPARAEERRKDYEALEPRAFVFYAADFLVEHPWPPDKKTRRRELVRRVREHDRHLSSWAIPVFRKNDQARAVVASILRGQGLRDDAEDTLGLVALFRKSWAEVGSKVPITLAYLAEAEGDAHELIQHLDTYSAVEAGSPRDLRRRAFTMWLHSYNEILHLGRYLLRGDAGAAQRLAAISADRAGAERDEEEDEGEEDAGLYERS